MSNLSVIYGAICGAGYSGLLIAVTYYVVNFADPAAVSVIGALNQVVASATRGFGGFVASGFDAFQKGLGRLWRRDGLGRPRASRRRTPHDGRSDAAGSDCRRYHPPARQRTRVLPEPPPLDQPGDPAAVDNS